MINLMSGVSYSQPTSYPTSGSWTNPNTNTNWRDYLSTPPFSPFGTPVVGTTANDYPSLMELTTAPFTAPNIQALLPPALQYDATKDMLGAGMGEIADLINNPGGVGKNLQAAIQERLAAENASIGQNYSGLASEQAGAAARGNAPVSIKGALQRALDNAENRAMRNAQRTAIGESEALRRTDVGETYNVLDAILQFLSSARGQAIEGVGAAEQLHQQDSASQMAALASILNSIATSSSSQG